MLGSMFAHAATTEDVTVRVQPHWLEDQSDPEAGQWVWHYHIRLENGRDEAVQLLDRHWIITDALGRVAEVSGPGVVGETPVIGPGAAFDYVSGCPLETPAGEMRGSYGMVTAGGQRFRVEIPAFTLTSPHARGRAH